MIILTSADIFEVVTSSTSGIDYVAAYVDHTTTGATPGQTGGAISTATTTTAVAAPAASTQRQIRGFSLRNTGTAANALTVQIDTGGTNRTILKATIQAGEQLLYSEARGWYSLDDLGRERVTRTESLHSGYTVGAVKVGAVMEAAGVWHSHHAATGTPGAWAPGTPGLTGRATDGTTAADAGALPIRTPVTGYGYLHGLNAAASVACSVMLIDILWVNTGTVVTTTTAQTVNSVTFASRDLDGATSGNDVRLGILVTTATTNAGAIANTTAVYTNQAGTGSKTATIPSFPATAVAGTLVPFALAAGDEGVRSVQSVTLGTSYGGGAISLVAFRILALVGCPVASVAAAALLSDDGVRLYAGTTAILVQIPTATTATTITAAAYVVEQ